MTQVSINAGITNLETAILDLERRNNALAVFTQGEGNLPLEWTSNKATFVLDLKYWGPSWQRVNRNKHVAAALETLRSLYRDEEKVKAHLDRAANAVGRGARLKVIGTRFSKAFETAIYKLSRKPRAEFLERWQQLSIRDLDEVTEIESLFNQGFEQVLRRDTYLGSRLVATTLEVVREDDETNDPTFGRLYHAKVALQEASQLLEGARQLVGQAKTGLEIAATNLETTIATQQAFMTSQEVMDGFVWGEDTQIVKRVQKAASVRSNLETNYLAASEKVKVQAQQYNVCAKNRKEALDAVVSAQRAIEYAQQKAAEEEAKAHAALRAKLAAQAAANNAAESAAARLQSTAAQLDAWQASRPAQPAS